MAEFERGIQLDPNSFEAHYFYGRACFAQNRLKQAAALFERAGELKPDDYQSVAFLTMIYRSIGREAEIEAVARKALERAERELTLHPENRVPPAPAPTVWSRLASGTAPWSGYRGRWQSIRTTS
jgi:adenylate cyclase